MAATHPKIPANWIHPSLDNFRGADWNARTQDSYVPYSVSHPRQHKRPATALPSELIKQLASYDVRRNPKLTTWAGLNKWKAVHPDRVISWHDVNSDGIPDALAGWDKNKNQNLDHDEISHVNGYFLKRSDWPYRIRYNADKLRQPTVFEKGKMPMSRYIRQMYDASTDPETGTITYNPYHQGRQAWEDLLKRNHYVVKKPGKQISPMNLWRMWVFKPAYDCFVRHGGDPNGQVIMVDDKPLYAEPEFKSLLMGQKAYKMLFTDWLEDQYKEYFGENINQRQLEVIRKQKEFKEELKRLVKERLTDLEKGWWEVFHFLTGAAGFFFGLTPDTFEFDVDHIRARYEELLAQYKGLEESKGLHYLNPDLNSYKPEDWLAPDFVAKRPPTHSQEVWDRYAPELYQFGHVYGEGGVAPRRTVPTPPTMPPPKHVEIEREYVPSSPEVRADFH
jgi:hypothetical protein